MKFGHLGQDLLLHVLLAFVCLLTSLAQLMTEFVLELVRGSDLSLSALLFLANDLGTHAELEDTGIELDGVLDTLEPLVNVLHALDLADVGTDTLWVLADRIDLLLQPALLLLDSVFDSNW